MLTQNEQLGLMVQMIGLATVADGDDRANDVREALAMTGLYCRGSVDSESFDAVKSMKYARDGVKFITEQLDLLEKSLTDSK